VAEGWIEWERDKPDWFTEHWKALVPADWVPTEGKAEWQKARDSVVSAMVSQGRLSRIGEEAEEEQEEEAGGGSEERDDSAGWQ
jgi:hypothetical protein